MSSALLTLADSRLPAGGHAHSGGVEQAVAAGLVRDPASLAAFLLRRLQTAGRVAAGLASASSVGGDLAALDAEADARTPSPALRAASRQQGRGLVRVGRRAWPSPLWDALPAAPHHPVALGVAAAAGGLTPRDAAAAAAYLSVSGPATAAQRLLAMDPLTVAAVTARLAPEIDAVADAAVREGLPADTDPLLDLLAEVHATRGDRFFAS
ncbi:urease accessory protein UreF [Geodermatophilus sp. SYSU D00698]